MNILMSFYQHWTEQIFLQEKILEFRTRIGKDFRVGTKIYMYEAKKNGGSGKVVGEFQINEIEKLPTTKVGTYGLLPYFCEHILQDEVALTQVKAAYAISVPNYDKSIKLDYIYNLEFLRKLSKGEDFSFLDMSREEFLNYEINRKKAEKLIKACDEWLYNIGFYNQYGETNYHYYLGISNVLKYESPISVSEFKNVKGENLTKPPQSWCYVK